MLITILKSLWFITLATGFMPIFAIVLAVMIFTDKLGLTHFQD